MEDSTAQLILDELRATRLHFDTVAADLDGKIRRHFGVVAEGLEHKVQIVAEGVSMVAKGVQELRSEMAGEFVEVRSMVKLSYTELDRRLVHLESSLGSLQARVARLEKNAA